MLAMLTPTCSRAWTATWSGSSRRWARAACACRSYITKSNGGITPARDARQATAETLLSGPASGVIGAAYVCRPGRATAT